MNKEIGSELPLTGTNLFRRSKNDFKNFFPKKSRNIFLSSGRDCIHYIISLLDLKPGEEVLVPAYSCKEVISPFVQRGVKVRFFKVGKKLEVGIRSLRKNISKNTKAILIIHYFGFPQDIIKIKKICKLNNIYLIEDCAQSFLSKKEGLPLGTYSDVSFSSLRKLIAIPDGAVLCINNKRLKKYIKIFDSADHKNYVKLRFFMMILKQIFLHTKLPIKKIFRSLFFRSEKKLIKYRKPASMSKISKVILKKYGLKKVVEKRRENFNYLLKRLQKVGGILSFYTTLPKETCPLGLPVIIRERDQIREKLIKKRIYPAIHWDLDHIPKTFKNEHMLSDHILTLPIDHTLNTEDLDRMIGVLEDV